MRPPGGHLACVIVTWRAWDSVDGGAPLPVADSVGLGWSWRMCISNKFIRASEGSRWFSALATQNAPERPGARPAPGMLTEWSDWVPLRTS